MSFLFSDGVCWLYHRSPRSEYYAAIHELEIRNMAMNIDLKFACLS
jgi:hypothetical protein